MMADDTIQQELTIEEETIKNGEIADRHEKEAEQSVETLYATCQALILLEIVNLLNKLEKMGGKWEHSHISQLTKEGGLIDKITAIITDLAKKEIKFMEDYLSKQYIDQFLREIYCLGRYNKITAKLNLIEKPAVKKAITYPWSGAMFSDRIWQQKELLIKELRKTLIQSMVLGESIAKLSEKMAKTLHTSRYNAERIIRTESKRICYIAHAEAYKSAGVEQVKYRIANGGDGRVCSRCKEDHNKVYDLGKEPTLPRHPNCRCLYIPVVHVVFKSNELNDLTDSIRGAENYNDWLKHYKEILNQDGTYKEGWGRDKNTGKIVYTTSNDKKLTFEEYKRQSK